MTRVPWFWSMVRRSGWVPAPISVSSSSSLYQNPDQPPVFLPFVLSLTYTHVFFVCLKDEKNLKVCHVG
jgi:hypothetical protein